MEPPLPTAKQLKAAFTSQPELLIAEPDLSVLVAQSRKIDRKRLQTPEDTIDSVTSKRQHYKGGKLVMPTRSQPSSNLQSNSATPDTPSSPSSDDEPLIAHPAELKRQHHLHPNNFFHTLQFPSRPWRRSFRRILGAGRRRIDVTEALQTFSRLQEDKTEKSKNLVLVKLFGTAEEDV